MLQDSRMTILDDEGFTANVAEGAIDLYGLDIADAHARGAGSTLAVQVVIKRGGTGAAAFGGTATITVSCDDTDGLTTTIQTNIVNGADPGHDGVVATVFLPEQPEGRYLGVSVNDASLTGGGDANVVDAWIFSL